MTFFLVKGVVLVTTTTQYPVVFDQKRWTRDDGSRWSRLIGEHKTVSEDAGTVRNTQPIDEMFDASAVARIEFIRDEPKRGAILMDTRGRVLVHVVNALLGYVGNGPMLSEMIFDTVGIPKDIFETIQGETFGLAPYAIGLWRTSPDLDGWEWEQLQ